MEDFVYDIHFTRKKIKINADWNKEPWTATQYLQLKNYMGSTPLFFPEVRLKMLYDEKNLYLIFNVRDKFVRSRTTDINGPVWEDSCAELFFSPDPDHPERYFNLEVNCGGTPLMQYNIVPRKNFIRLEPADIVKIEIAHTLAGLVDPEIKDDITWNLEYRLPLDILVKYSPVTFPSKGIRWRANFYKVAENNSNPHYITWTRVENYKPDFHLPQFFGTLLFN